jgi:hypothetical protein
MCDTLAVVGEGRAVFAKNSDRPPGEPQVVEWNPARPALPRLRTQYLELDDTPGYAFCGSRSTWLWGAEHGVNEHGLAVGNEKVWTVDDPRAQPPALIGMDLVRLALERAATADDALDIVTSLLARHGQGGSGEADHDEPYYSSFLLVDPHGGWVLETSARTWAARPLTSGAAISNRISLTTDWTRASRDVPTGHDFDQWRDPLAPTGIADHRLHATSAVVERGAIADPRTVVATLRHHGTRPWGAPGGDPGDVCVPPADVQDDWSGVTVCMHIRGYQATTASMIAEIHSDATPTRLWTALGSPCASVYVPCFPPAIPAELALASEWARFAALRDRVEGAPDALADVRAVLAPVEAELWDEADDLAAGGDPVAAATFAVRAYRPVDAALRRLGV